MSDSTKDDCGQSSTLVIHCPTCESDYGDTLGVTGSMDGSLSATVVMRCDKCETVYLTPPPTVELRKDKLSPEQEHVYGPHIRNLKQNAPDDKSFLSAKITDAFILNYDPQVSIFGHILLPLSLESSPEPTALLTHVESLLDKNGRVDVVVGNSASSCFAVFGGRHWCGYRWPDTCQHYTAKGIDVISRRAGLRVMNTRAVASPHAWLCSFRNLLQDWGAHGLVVTVLTGRWVFPWLVASAIEGVARLRGKGAVLIAQLSKV